jgi:hypothetical protein
MKKKTKEKVVLTKSIQVIEMQSTVIQYMSKGNHAFKLPYDLRQRDNSFHSKEISVIALR